MKISFKKIGGLFLAIFVCHFVRSNVICQLGKGENCEKDIPHIPENIIMSHSHFTNIAVFISGSPDSTVSYNILKYGDS